MPVNVRIGTGSFEDFNCLIDARWGDVPRAGDSVFDPREGEVYTVEQVRYVLGPDESLTGAMILITKDPKVTDGSILGMIG